MHLFRYASDYYGESLAQQLLLPAAVLCFLTVVLFAGLHALRRSTGQPRSTEHFPPDAFPERAARYEIGARLYHWGNAVFVIVLAISGYALFVPGVMKPAAGGWLRIHEWAAAAFAAGILVHAVAAPFKGEGRAMWFEGRDWRDMRTIVSNFLGRTRQYPAFGKYDPFQKLYHAAVVLLSACVIASGCVLTVSAEVWTTVPRDLLRWMRLLHDVSAVSFVSIVAGHVYFGVIRVNWPTLGSIVTGRLSGAYLRLYHSPQRWRPAGQSHDGTGG